MHSREGTALRNRLFAAVRDGEDIAWLANRRSVRDGTWTHAFERTALTWAGSGSWRISPPSP